MNVFSILNMIGMLSSSKSRQLNAEEAKAFLADSNKDGIPDFLDEGLALEDLGIDVGKQRTQAEIEQSRQGAKKMGEAIKRFGFPEHVKQAARPKEDTGRAFLLIGAVIAVTIIYFVFFK